MKLYILLFFSLGILGVLFEILFKIITRPTKIEVKLKEISKFIMFFVYGLGGILIKLLYSIPFLQEIQNLYLMVLIGGLVATIVELASGYLFNILLKMDLWDYSKSKIKLHGQIIYLNFKGQIDVYHSFFWCILTLFVCHFSAIIEFLTNY